MTNDDNDDNGRARYHALMYRLLTAFVMAVGLGQGAAPAPAPPPAELRILFIGNSLTAANDLPAMVESVARAANRKAITRMVAFADYSLEDHWKRGDARRAIVDGGWSLVVLQQGPSALPESQVLLREYTKRFEVDIRRSGARPALYMVWPSRARQRDFDGVSRSYTAAASDVGGLLFAVGDAWRSAWARDPSIALYGSDGFHPTPAASYLAALVIVRKAFDVSVIGLPAPGFAASVAAILQDAAMTIG